jgi:hypothetical protein
MFIAATVHNPVWQKAAAKSTLAFCCSARTLCVRSGVAGAERRKKNPYLALPVLRCDVHGCLQEDRAVLEAKNSLYQRCCDRSKMIVVTDDAVKAQYWKVGSTPRLSRCHHLCVNHFAVGCPQNKKERESLEAEARKSCTCRAHVCVFGVFTPRPCSRRPVCRPRFSSCGQCGWRWRGVRSRACCCARELLLQWL